MRHLLSVVVFVAAIVFILFGSNVGQATDPPHDEAHEVLCVDCHGLHAGPSEPLPRDDEQAERCFTCHSEGAMAEVFSDVANHVVDSGALIIDCGSCHDPHGPHVVVDPHSGVEAENLRLIRSDTTRYVPDALEPAVFQENPAHFAFDGVSEPWNGICQTCHLSTAFHTSDGVGDHDHVTGFDCTGCHAHEDGFLPQVDCDRCHDQSSDAHPNHLVNDFYSAPIPCNSCHIVPETWDDPPHLDGVVDVYFEPGSTATWDGNNPTWDGTSCQDVFCHGPTLTEGTNTNPAWLDVGVDCGWCHVAPRDDLDCVRCHSVTSFPDGTLSHERHINGALDFNW